MDVGFDGYKLLLEKAWLTNNAFPSLHKLQKKLLKVSISIDKMGLFVYEYYLFLHQ